ncbi:MAG: SxtJ family membrane protein [Proteobacteria bacterium]|nr:SxtJ family membrane protein [Pseudomonadota bacterium]MDA1022994.1 SxtJ family membrane protein [Pseudomonadota bacterium]
MTDKQGLHEDFGRDDDVRAGSERAFGIVFAVVFTIIGLWPLLDGEPFRIWALAIAGIFLSAGLLLPVVLKPLNRAWFLFGQVLHKIVNPLIMGLLFFLTIIPIALMMRVVGKDPLQRKFDPDAETYWIKRDPPGPAPDSMRQQF